MIPIEIKEQYAFHGTGFQNGKERVQEYFLKEPNSKKRIEFLKKEYGVGGFSGPCKNPMELYGGSSFPYGKKNCHEIKWKDENLAKKTDYITLDELVKVIDAMITEERYLKKNDKTITTPKQMTIDEWLGGTE